jgi:hypothetical protein
MLNPFSGVHVAADAELLSLLVDCDAVFKLFKKRFRPCKLFPEPYNLDVINNLLASVARLLHFQRDLTRAIDLRQSALRMLVIGTLGWAQVSPRETHLEVLDAQRTG